MVTIATKGYNSGEDDIYIIKTDAEGNFQWEKTFGGIGRDVSVYISIDNDNQIFLSGLTFDTPTQNAATIILKLDTMGNEIFRKTLLYTPGKDHCGAYIFPALEKGYIMHGCMDTIINEGEFDLPHYVGKLDEEANIEWMTFFNEAREKWVANIYEMSDGHIMVVGIDKNHPETAVNDNSGFLAKLSPQGEILWQRNYQGLDKSWQIQDMCLTLDGGFALTGRYSNRFNEPDNEGDVWLLKVDSMGCLEPGCGSDLIRVDAPFVYTDIEEVPTIPSGGFSIYPNPLSTESKVYFHSSTSTVDFLQIHDLTGRLVFSSSISVGTKKFSLKGLGLKQGMYGCSVLYQGKVLQQQKILVVD
ncbi:MAG: T9SS type A sorting domain-containing protein [Chitinophagales bacterium]